LRVLESPSSLFLEARVAVRTSIRRGGRTLLGSSLRESGVGQARPHGPVALNCQRCLPAVVHRRQTRFRNRPVAALRVAASNGWFAHQSGKPPTAAGIHSLRLNCRPPQSIPKDRWQNQLSQGGRHPAIFCPTLAPATAPVTISRRLCPDTQRLLMASGRPMTAAPRTLGAAPSCALLIQGQRSQDRPGQEKQAPVHV